MGLALYSLHRDSTVLDEATTQICHVQSIVYAGETRHPVMNDRCRTTHKHALQTPAAAIYHHREQTIDYHLQSLNRFANKHQQQHGGVGYSALYVMKAISAVAYFIFSVAIIIICIINIYDLFTFEFILAPK